MMTPSTPLLAASLCALTLQLSTPPVVAQEVFKSVDAQGNVVYSDSPPAAAVETQTLEIAPGPTTEQVEQAQELTRQLKQSGDELEAKRIEREKVAAEQRRLDEERRRNRETEERLAQLEERQRQSDYRNWGAYYDYYPTRPIWRHPPDGPGSPVNLPAVGIPSAGSGGGASHVTRGASHAH